MSAAAELLVMPWSLDLLEQIASYVHAGASIPVACEAAGVRWTTAKNWMHRGNHGERPYDEFVARMRRAQARHVVAMQVILSTAAKKQWRCAAYLDAKRERRAERRAERLMRARLAQGAHLPTPGEEPTILCYPVPAPLGAEAAQLDQMRAANAPPIDLEDDP